MRSPAGTSFAAPAFARHGCIGEQKTIRRKGWRTTICIAMAAQEFGSTASPNNSQTLSCNSGSNQGGVNSCTFYDVTVGNIEHHARSAVRNATLDRTSSRESPRDTPRARLRYGDGLGSVNATNLVNNWAALTAATQPTVVTLSASSLSSSYGQPITLSVSVTPLSGSGTPPVRLPSRD